MSGVMLANNKNRLSPAGQRRNANLRPRIIILRIRSRSLGGAIAHKQADLHVRLG